MKSIINFIAFIAILPSRVSSQPWGGGNPNSGFGNWIGNFPSCASPCSPQWDSSCTTTNRGDCICKNETIIADINSCVESSTCSDEEKSSIYQKITSLCAAAGTTITAAPEASFTGSLLSVTNNAWSSGYPYGKGPFSNGPFGGEDWGSRTSGPWTAWWGGKGCPDATWSGWTSGAWTSDAEWTSWTACTASTTATTTFTSADAVGAVVTVTGVGVRVEEQGSAAVLGIGRGVLGAWGLWSLLMVVMVLL